jgi:carbon storage regulator CsrA
MLVLARGPGQSVVLDDRITVTVLASRPGLVRLGIEAPDGVGVRRGELDLLDPGAVGVRRRTGGTRVETPAEAPPPA